MHQFLFTYGSFLLHASYILTEVPRVYAIQLDLSE